MPVEGLGVATVGLLVGVGAWRTGAVVGLLVTGSAVGVLGSACMAKFLCEKILSGEGGKPMSKLYRIDLKNSTL